MKKPTPNKPSKTGAIGSSQRQLKVKVKTAHKRKTGSNQWLERHLNDPYVAAAREAGYRSRAAFKLIEIDDKYRFLKPGQSVLDLGAAPGGWCQIAAQRTFAKLGFHQEAELPGHVKDIHGKKRDLLIYANDVSHIWSAMEALVEDYRPHEGH